MLHLDQTLGTEIQLELPLNARVGESLCISPNMSNSALIRQTSWLFQSALYHNDKPKRKHNTESIANFTKLELHC